MPLIAAEDTRISRRLLGALRDRDAARRATTRAAARARLAELLAHLRGGADLALVTDAGTPGRQRPGRRARRGVGRGGRHGGPDPGRIGRARGSRPRAAIAGPALGRSRASCRAPDASGASGSRESPRDDRATVLFEAPTRLAATLRDLAAACGAERRGGGVPRADEAPRADRARDARRARGAAGDGAIPARGEVVIVVGPDAARTSGRRRRPARRRSMPARARVAELVAAGMARSEAARRVATETGLPRRDLYREVQDRPGGPEGGAEAARATGGHRSSGGELLRRSGSSAGTAGSSARQGRLQLRPRRLASMASAADSAA